MSTPEYTRKNVSFPTNGSVAILNASAANGASSFDLALLEVLVVVRQVALDRGHFDRRRQVVDHRVEQRLHALVLERGAAEHRHDTPSRSVALRIARRISSMRQLLAVEVLLHQLVVVLDRGLDRPRGAPASTASLYSAGTSTTSNVLPRLASSKMYCLRSMTSMWPVNSSPEPTGSWSANARLRQPSRIIVMQRSKSAPTRSILFEKIMRGTLYRSAWRHTVSVCGSTPATESSSATAPSSTRSDRSTSTVKSTWPGVSMMLIRYSASPSSGRGAPEARRRGRRDRDAALLLLLHPVHRRGAFVHLADFVAACRYSRGCARS